MKAIFQNIMSVLLAVLVLGSTMSFTVSKHYCGEHLVDVSIFGEAQACEMQEALTHKYGDDHSKKMECCSDQETVLDAQDELKHHFEDFSLENLEFIEAYTHTYLLLFDTVVKKVVITDRYLPPLITQDYQELFEQYLI
ncbi:HYC_CC_PP family protein [Dokdonia donghaensis]|uniref:HYC_CC_PP family protein n=1 Tax=Dokdonia donghaensis TaxID=326320 RepID=UPI0035C7C165